MRVDIGVAMSGAVVRIGQARLELIRVVEVEYFELRIISSEVSPIVLQKSSPSDFFYHVYLYAEYGHKYDMIFVRLAYTIC